MSLSNITKGRVQVPHKVLVYGVEGIGKSTFAASAPKPIFLCSESGTAQLDVHRLPTAHTWEDIVDGVSLLINETHDYKTAVIDTVDWAEPMLWDYVCRSSGDAKIRSIEDFGFGKGYIKAMDGWRMLLRGLEKLTAKGMNVVLLGHSKVALFKNPDGEDFDRYTLRMHEKSAGMLKEWCDDVLFAHFETFTLPKKADGKEQRKAIAGSRVLSTIRKGAWDAKSRNSLPEELPLSWADYVAAMGGAALSTDAIRTAIADVSSALPEEKRAKLAARVVEVGENATKLSALLDWCRSQVGINNNPST